MTEIQQYRKVSAEQMGINYKVVGKALIYSTVYGWGEWHPDQDYNQMAMMKKKLIEEGCFLNYLYAGETHHWNIDDSRNRGKVERYSEGIEGVAKDELIAFMKAWTEYNSKDK